MDYMVVVVPVLTAVVFAAAGYFKAKEAFNPIKFLATLGIGAFIGIVALMSGVEVTEAYVGAQALMFGGAITVLEDVIKGILKRV
jgi:hypothetical protein